MGQKRLHLVLPQAPHTARTSAIPCIACSLIFSGRSVRANNVRQDGTSARGCAGQRGGLHSIECSGFGRGRHSGCHLCCQKSTDFLERVKVVLSKTPAWRIQLGPVS